MTYNIELLASRISRQVTDRQEVPLSNGMALVGKSAGEII